MKNFLTVFPGPEALIEQYPEIRVLEVNAHLHSPYSFSAFKDISEIFSMAVSENIAVAGINDFFVTDGYEPFFEQSVKSGVFPLFNIEFIALMKEEQQQNIRINDPNNPGRCYFTGKGLDYPFNLEKNLRQKLMRIVKESQGQVHLMISRANEWFRQMDAGIHLSYDDIRTKYARELVRERHIAKAIRMSVYEKHRDPESQKELFTLIFSGKEPKSTMDDIPSLENEIRGHLLKAGGKAFVEENDNAFMSLEEVVEIIIGAGGIPCYPVLLDDKNGMYTEYEQDAEKLFQELSQHNIRCIELIPGRNDAGHLDRFVRIFQEKDFMILFGTEHNSPEMIPLTCDTRGKLPLHADIRRISWEGACAIAAHQYLRAKGYLGLLSPAIDKTYAVHLGNAVIHHFKNQYLL